MQPILDDNQISPQKKLLFKNRLRYYTIYILLCLVLAVSTELIGQYFGKREMGILAILLFTLLGAYYFVRFLFQSRKLSDTFSMVTTLYIFGLLSTLLLEARSTRWINEALAELLSINTHLMASTLMALLSSLGTTLLSELGFRLRRWLNSIQSKN